MLFGNYELCPEYPIVRRRLHVRPLPESACPLTLAFYESVESASQESDGSATQIINELFTIQLNSPEQSLAQSLTLHARNWFSESLQR
jgi:hypothetical protein